MRVTIRMFARLRELTGADELTRIVPAGMTVRDIWAALVREFPALEPLGASVSAAVNAEYRQFDTVVHDGDELAFLPPVSGG